MSADDADADADAATVTGAAAEKLRVYREKRDFGKTAEPSGGTPSTTGDVFVIQKHAARRLHYDLRLELDGVMLSWAIPKGPSFDTKTRRLAVRTEDHPLDYAGFEGVIPRGEYGGGAMIVWDRGRWRCEGDGEGSAQRQLEEGHLKFTLEGEKVHGRWHLLRTKGFDDADGNGKGESWLFFKGKDEFVDRERDVVAERPESVVSGRTVEEVASGGGGGGGSGGRAGSGGSAGSGGGVAGSG
ncbi:MAG TPA: DNA polymerase ligase N-terminal domain-containing protein [Kofleriaceae bacterium]|nr:DNA polymerase ligase N-terminal domain-containing protein [Kofleriaceae bacterium]